MPINYKSFNTLVTDQVVAIQGASTPNIDFNVGTVELAMVEANAAMGIWLEYLANAILALARASTSQGTDLDTWMAQFRFSRLPAVASSGNVTFSRFVTTGTASIPVGALVQTSDFSLEFMVIADTSNPNFNPSLNEYIMIGGVGSTLARVQCTTLGAVGNVAADTITFISSALPGVDSVNNGSAFENGKDQESDAAFRARFVLYINSLSRAVLFAYDNLLASFPEIVRYNVVENKSFAGADMPGFVYVVIDDGTGAPPPALIAAVAAGIEKIRGLAIQNAVYGPTDLNINIQVDLEINDIETEAEITASVTSALTELINKYPFDTDLIYTKMYEVIYSVSPNIIRVENLLINGGTVDIVGTENTSFTIGTLTIGYL